MTTEIKYYTREKALEIVTHDAYELKFCTPELKNDKEVVMAAIKNANWSFEYASNELKNNKVFIMKALNEGVKPWGLIVNACINIQSDFDVIFLALEKGVHGREFSSSKGEASLNKELAAKAIVKWFKIPGNSNELLWERLHPTLKEIFPKDCCYEKAQAHLIQLEQEKQAELVSGGSTAEDEVVW